MDMERRKELGKLEQKKVSTHIGIGAMLLWGLLLLITVRYGWLQLVQGDAMATRVRMESGEEQVTPTPRGPILDRNGRELAFSLMLKSLFVDPNNVQNPNNLTPPVTINRNLNYSKEKTSVNYSVSKEVKQVVYAPGTVKRLSIAVAINKVLTDAERDEIKNLISSAAGIDYSRGDAVNISGLQFEGAKSDRTAQEKFEKQYRQEQLFNFITTSVFPLLIVLLLGTFSLIILKSFVNKMPEPKKVERRHYEEAPPLPQEDEEDEESLPKYELNKKELRSQKDQNINELNEAVMSSPEEAAKLLVSFIKD